MTAIYPTDAEVTVTITGRAVYSDDGTGSVVVEYMNERGWPDRISVRPSSGVAIVGTPAPSVEEIRRRRGAWLQWADACADGEPERDRIRAQAPYGEVLAGHGGEGGDR